MDLIKRNVKIKTRKRKGDIVIFKPVVVGKISFWTRLESVALFPRAWMVTLYWEQVVKSGKL